MVLINLATEMIANIDPIYRVFWLSALADLLPWQDKLDRFFTRVGSHNRFANWANLQHYLAHFNHQLRLCVVTDTHYAIKGILLLKQNKSELNLFNRLDALGNYPHTTDVNEILLHPDADAQTLIPVLGNALINAPFKWDTLDWHFIQPEAHWQLLANTLKPHVNHIELTADMPRPALVLPSSEADYLKQRSSRVKKFVNNKQNRLGRDFPDQLPQLRWVSPEETAAVLDWFFPAYMAYWDKQGIKTEFHRYPDLIPFYHDAITQGLLKLTGYFVGNDIACVFVGYDLSQKTYLLHLTCFNPKYGEYSPGILHNDALIKLLIEQGYTTLDFGLGDLEYKSYFTKTKLPTWQLQVYRSGFGWLVSRGSQLGKTLIKNMLASKVTAENS